MENNSGQIKFCNILDSTITNDGIPIIKFAPKHRKKLFCLQNTAIYWMEGLEKVTESRTDRLDLLDLTLWHYPYFSRKRPAML